MSFQGIYSGEGLGREKDFCFKTQAMMALLVPSLSQKFLSISARDKGQAQVFVIVKSPRGICSYKFETQQFTSNKNNKILEVIELSKLENATFFSVHCLKSCLWASVHGPRHHVGVV